MRVVPSVLEQAPIVCGACGKPFRIPEVAPEPREEVRVPDGGLTAAGAGRAPAARAGATAPYGTMVS